jgi:hypothetical protein
VDKMGFTKFTVSEDVQKVEQEKKEKIQAVLKTANKKSVEELTDEEKERLDIYLSS